jgi:hypothetical protein
MKGKLQFLEGGQLQKNEKAEMPIQLPETVKLDEQKSEGKSLNAWFKVTPLSMQGKIELGNVSNGVIILCLVIVFLLVLGIVLLIGLRVGDA